MKPRSKIILIFFVATFLLTPFVLWAQQPSILSQVPCLAGKTSGGQSPDCTAESIIDLVRALMTWGFRISGALALLMYVIGGMWMIFSAGNSSRIEHGKDILIGTSVSLIFIFGSAIIVDFVLTGLESSYRVQQICTAAQENKTCGNPQNATYCYSGECITKCEKLRRDAQKDALRSTIEKWQCQSPSSCGLSYDDCQNGNFGYCQTGLCPGKEENVCCYNPIQVVQ